MGCARQDFFDGLLVFRRVRLRHGSFAEERVVARFSKGGEHLVGESKICSLVADEDIEVRS